MKPTLNPVTWIVWVGAVLIALSATRNPVYLALALLWIAVVARTVDPTAAPPIPLSPLKFGLFVVPVSALFNGLTVHVGSTVFFRLPASWVLIGGPFTLESVVYGALNGLVLTGMFAVFGVLNCVLPVRSLVRLIPRAFYPVAVVISIAVTFVPTTLRQFEQIKEAQAVRGHKLRGPADWLPLMLPLLVGGLERALKLAEAMVARGFAAGRDQSQAAFIRAGLALALALVVGGWLLNLVWKQAWGLGLLAVGVILAAALVWAAGRKIPRTVYRPEGWSLPDGLILYCSVAAGAVFLFPLPGVARETIFYYPYPRLIPPGVDPLIAVATIGLLGPVLLKFRQTADGRK